MNIRKLQHTLRRATWIIAACGVLYLLLRYDNQALPANGCSPLRRFAAGNSLLCDRRPTGYEVGDAVMVHGPDGLLYLGAVTRVRPIGASRADVQEVWVETDASDCPGKDSEDFGWIVREDCSARVLFAWPW